eukprot:1561163-Rhodomonas_salina.2
MLVARVGRLACGVERRACQAHLQAPGAATILSGRHTVGSLPKRSLGWTAQSFSRVGAVNAGGSRLMSTAKSHKWTMYEADPSMYLTKGS